MLQGRLPTYIFIIQSKSKNQGPKADNRPGLLCTGGAAKDDKEALYGGYTFARKNRSAEVQSVVTIRESLGGHNRNMS